MKMDEIDKKILQLLQHNSRISIKEMSKQISLSEPSVKTRMDRLIENGVIEKFTIQINEAKLGLTIPYIIKISDIQVTIHELVEVLKNYPNITEAHAVTGGENYIVKGRAQDITEIDRLLNQLMPYGTINTSIILESPIEREIRIE